MTINLPDDLANLVRAEVLSGHFANEEELVAAAVRDYLGRKQGPGGQPGDAAEGAPTQELQRRLLAAGLVSEIKPPITDLTPYQNRQAVAIEGEPLSATVIRERR